MVNFWEETAVDRKTDDGSAPAARIVLGYEGLAGIIERIKAGRATYEERARVLVLAEEVEGEGIEMVALAGRLRALAGGGDAVGMVGGGALPGGGVPGVAG